MKNMSPLEDLLESYKRHSIREARKVFSEIIRNASLLSERQIITKNNKDCVAIVPIEDLKRLEAYDKLVDQLLEEDDLSAADEDTTGSLDISDLATKHYSPDDFTEGDSESENIKAMLVVLNEQNSKINKLEEKISQQKAKNAVEPTVFVSVNGQTSAAMRTRRGKHWVISQKSKFRKRVRSEITKSIEEAVEENLDTVKNAGGNPTWREK